MATDTAVTRGQFVLTPNEVTHEPTGATFTSWPGLDKVIASVIWGNCRLIPPSGENDSHDKGEALARVLMAEQASAADEICGERELAPLHATH